MNCLSLFSGIGGFDLGFERAGIQTVAMCEADSIARNILHKHWPDVPVIEDVSDLDGREYRTVEIISGGFPCQDISVAGNRKGLAGSKSGLWWEFYRIVSESMPKWVVIENVAGLMSSGGRRDLGAIIGSLGELGYLGGYRVLDARYFGVAQRRRRMFIVGSLGNNGGQKVFFESEGLPGDLEKSRQEGKKNSGAALQSSSESSKLLAESGVVGSLTKSFGGAGADAQHAQNGWLVPVPFAENQRSEVIYTDLPTLSTGGGKPGQGYPAILSYPNNSGTVMASWAKGPGNAQVDEGHVIPSLDSQQNLEVRRLTPVECERLMGLPDNWTKFGADGKTIADSHRYRFCGNAVVSNVAEWLGKRIVAVDQS
jgi:DNA (cytosine-5)-methyltransferase 1